MEENKNPAVVKAEKLADIGTVVERETSPISTQKTEKERQKELKAFEKEKNIENLQRERDERERLKRQSKDVKFREYACRQKNEEDNSSRSSGKNFWVATSLILALSTIIMGGLFAKERVTTDTLDREVENGYKKSFYSAVDYTDELALNIDKFLVSTDRESAQKYLVDIAVDAEMLEDNLQQLPIHDESKYNTAKLVNQVADYAKYLNKKLISGASVLEEEIKNVKRLDDGVKSLQRQLGNMSDKMNDGFTFSDMKSDSFVIQGFNELENSSMDYPALIYDGPFSDSRIDAKAKGLTENEVTLDKARENAKKAFSKFGVNELNFEGEVSGKVTAYCFTANSDLGSLYIQVSKAGGKVIMFTSSQNSTKTDMSRSDKSKDSEDISAGENFLSELGISDMKAVWTAKSDGVSVINFAGYVEGTIIYPDLIKIKAEKGQVIGMEAYDYYLNHEERDIVSPSIDEQTAIEKVSSHLEVKNVRKSLIPVGLSEELCYEVMGEVDGATYYAYISATTGKQLQLFKVVEGTEGVLLR